MIQKTPAEKQQLKEAKKAHGQGIKQKAMELERRQKEESSWKFISTGLLPTENILPDDYTVFLDHVYVIDQGGGKVIRSDVAGNIAYLKRDLWKQGYLFENVYNCDVMQRRVKRE